jgi:hypothetical protein
MGAPDAVVLGGTVAVLLLAPTLGGALVGLATGAAPLAVAVGAAVGVAAASVVITRTVLRRYEQLAPTEAKEEETTE